MESQPQIFHVALLGEIEGQQKQSKNKQKNGVHHPGQALEEGMCAPEFEPVVEILAVAEVSLRPEKKEV